MAAENCSIQPGDTVAVFGCGPVGQFAIKSAWMLGAGRVIAVDREPERLHMAADKGKAETIDYSQQNPVDVLREMTGGMGPDACIDAVGLEAHGHQLDYWYDRAKTATMMATDRVVALRQAIHEIGRASCRERV